MDAMRSILPPPIPAWLGRLRSCTTHTRNTKNAEYTKRIYEKAEPGADSPSTRSAVFRLCEPGQRRFICVTTLQLSPQLPMSVGLRHFSGADSSTASLRSLIHPCSCALSHSRIPPLPQKMLYLQVIHPHPRHGDKHAIHTITMRTSGCSHRCKRHSISTIIVLFRKNLCRNSHYFQKQ